MLPSVAPPLPATYGRLASPNWIVSPSVWPYTVVMRPATGFAVDGAHVPMGLPPAWLPAVTTQSATTRPRRVMVVAQLGSRSVSASRSGRRGGVAVDVDEQVREDLAVGVRVDIVADQQRHAALLGEDRAVRQHPRRVHVVARAAGVGLGEPAGATGEQEEVLVVVGGLADGETVMSPV